MATITITYDARNSTARRAISRLRSMGVFQIKEPATTTSDAEEREAFIYTSRHNAAKIFGSKI